MADDARRWIIFGILTQGKPANGKYLWLDAPQFLPQLGPKTAAAGCLILICSTRRFILQDRDHLFAGFFISLVAQFLFLKIIALRGVKARLKNFAALLQNLDLLVELADIGLHRPAVLVYPPVGNRQKSGHAQRNQAAESQNQPGTKTFPFFAPGNFNRHGIKRKTESARPKAKNLATARRKAKIKRGGTRIFEVKLPRVRRRLASKKSGPDERL